MILMEIHHFLGGTRSGIWVFIWQILPGYLLTLQVRHRSEGYADAAREEVWRSVNIGR